jgi:hypothetical protein
MKTSDNGGFSLLLINAYYEQRKESETADYTEKLQAELGGQGVDNT